MAVQTSIEVPEVVPAPKFCAWCGEPATHDITCQPAKYRNHQGVRVVAKAAVTAPACTAHFHSIQRTTDA